MAISLASLVRTGEQKKPARILAHGVQGVGKSTLSSLAPAPVFIQCEDGLSGMDVDAFPLAKSFDDVMDAIVTLYQEEHQFQSVIIDSVDWLEPLVYAKTCAENGWVNIETPGFGKGYAAALDVWRRYLDGINALRDDKGMWIIQLAHTDIKKFSPPDSDEYDRYQIKLRDKTSALLLEHSDIVLFVNYLVSIKQTDTGFGQKKTRAVGGGQRVVYTAERPAYLAKSRYPLPDSIMVPGSDWSPVWDALHQAVGV